MPMLNIKEFHLKVIASLVPFLQQYPIMKGVLASNPRSSQNWDFYLTVAGVGMYIVSFKVPAKKQTPLRETLSSLDPEMIDALDDFLEMNEDARIDENTLSGNIGMWVLWNVKGIAPTNEEYNELSPAIEKFLIQGVKECSR